MITNLKLPMKELVMPTILQVDSVVKKVELLLAEEASKGIHLKVADHKLDDDWLYIVILPGEAGVRASDHAALMSKIERRLRAEGDVHVLLVPALED